LNPHYPKLLNRFQFLDATRLHIFMMLSSDVFLNQVILWISSNAVEETARRVAEYEIRYGEVNNLHAFMARAYSNVINSITRTGYYARYESPTSDRDLEAVAASRPHRGENRIEDAVLARQSLDMLDEKRRQLIVMSAEGFTAREIAARLGISEQNVNTCRHRARAKMKRQS